MRYHGHANVLLHALSRPRALAPTSTSSYADSSQCSAERVRGQIAAGEFRGVSSHYKHDSAGRLWLKTEGMMEDVSMVEAVALW